MQFRSCNGYLNTHDISRSIEIMVPAKCQISPNPLHYFKQDTYIDIGLIEHGSSYKKE